MKYVRFFMSCCFSMLSVLTMADNVTVESISMQAGEERQIAIGLNNSERNYVSCQFDIVVPQGFSIPSNSVMLDEERSNSHQYSFVKISDDRYRLMVYSMPVKPFGGNSGSIVYLKLQCENNVKAGTYSFSVVAQKFTDSDGKKYVFDDCRFSVTVEGIVVKGNSYRRKYGEENPHFGYTTDKAISGVPDVVCEASPKSPVGTYPIKVLKGSVTNSNVTFIDGELIIEEAPLTITADNKRMVRGEQVPEFTATYAGFKNGETASVLDKLPQFECDATESSEPGEYAIGVSGAEAQNYVISYENGILTIVDPDPIIVTVKNVSRKYGDPNPSAFEYTVEGGTLNGVPLVNCNATQESPVGKYDITIEKGTVSNYNVSFVKGTLTVEKAPLTILADDMEMLIGDSLPVFTATYRGFKNNETEGILTKAPKMECDATSLSPGGSYPISVFGAEAQNYEIGYESGLLTIIDPPLTVTATDCNREYGEPNPVFGYSVEGGRLIGEPILSTDATVESQVGSYGITIERGGIINANVTFVGGMLNIGKAPLQVKADDITIRQGDEMPPFTASYQGFKLADNEASLLKQPGFSCEVKNSSQIGEFAITVSGAESNNYDISYSVGVLRVVEAPVVIKVNNKVRLYGDENPHFDYTIEGGELKGLPVVRCEATPASSVGEYEIVIEKGTVTNNEVTFINGKLRIDKAPLTITADDKQMVLGEAIPEYTATYSGFKNGEDSSDLEQVPQFSCSATLYSEPGEYVIDVSGAQTSNYAINYVSGSLTILPPEPVIADVSNPVAGRLASQIEEAGFSSMKVNEMKVTGLLNGTDIKCIREMIIRGCLTSLDIEETSIVSGGEPYYNEYSIEEWTQNDVVGQFMFSDCKNLISIKLPKTVTLIEYAFDGCDNLLRLDIPESCQEVMDAISDCPSLTTITIPAATQTFDSYNCMFCPSLQSIEVDPANKWLASVDGVLFTKNMDELVKYPMGKQDTLFVAPKSIVSINDYAFSDALLQSVELPEGLLTIGAGAFDGCFNLVKIDIPQTVASIDMNAFGHCENLRELSLPKDVMEVSDCLAEYCRNLSYLRLPGSIQSVGSFAFGYCKSLTRIDSYIDNLQSVFFETDLEGGVDAFEGIPEDCVWHVKVNTKEAYLAQPWWIDSWTIIDDLICPGIVSSTISPIEKDDSWYTTDGIRLIGKPTIPGLYIYQGRKVVIK